MFAERKTLSLQAEGEKMASSAKSDSKGESMQGKVALVTGAASGIGRATAELFAERGAWVFLADKQQETGGAITAKIKERGGQADFVPCDVSCRTSEEGPASVERLFSTIRSRAGRLDYAFNNAGIEGESSLSGEITPELWRRVLSVNLEGVLWCLQSELALMLERGSGAIVNCASIAGLRGFAGSAAYVASKHGLVGLTRSAALDYASKGIRINSVCPGIIQTPMIERFTRGSADAQAALVAGEPMGRTGLPLEVASAVVWLCSEEASFVTGTELVVDGGWCAR
jgi:NAD(P)-dependent dehydrogenase (short-subunit alcohol dehydrogenase family)